MSINYSETFKAMQVRDYRRYFWANGISSLGTWMQRLGMSWLVYRLTDSANWLGVITFTGWFSSFLLMPWAGAMLDGGSRRQILVLSQLLGFLQAFVLALMTIYGTIDITWLVILSLMLGIVNAFDMPGRHSFVSDIVPDKKVLANAIALNSTGFNLARLVGPALAGLIVAKWGEGPCFLLNSLSFLPFAWVLHTIKPVEQEASSGKSESFRTRIIEGFRYSAQHRLIFQTFILLSTASFMGMSIHMVLFPIIADRQLGGGAVTLGYLSAAMGLGAVVGALVLASRRSLEGMEKLPPVAFGIYGLMTALLSQTSSLLMALAITSVMGACIVFGWSASNTLLQTIAAKDKLSRVMSIYMMCFSGMSPIGSLFMGWFSTHTSTALAMITGGGSCMLAALYFIKSTRSVVVDLSDSESVVSA